MTDQNTQLQVVARPENKLARVSMSELKELGELFYTSGQFSDVESAAVAMIKVLAGQEYGFAPITSMSNVHMINGRPVLSATAQASLIKTSGKYDFEVLELSRRTCRLQLFKKDSAGTWKKFAIEEFTWQDAVDAGLTSGKNAHTWKKFSRNMLFARCLTNASRFYFADLLRGEVGDPESIRFAEYEDLPDEPEIVEGEAIEVEEEAVVDAEFVTEEEIPMTSIANNPPPVDPEEAERADLLTAVNDKLGEVSFGDEDEIKKILKGRDPVQMPNEALSKLLIEITA